MSRVNVLNVEWRKNLRRPSLDAAEFTIDGRPLLEYCEGAMGRTFDLISPFGWTTPDSQQALAERLLLRRPPLLPTGRQEFLVCPECADLGCGCISAVSRLEGGHYTWSEFGYENNYDPDSLSLFPMGVFVVVEEELTRLLRRLAPGFCDTAD